MKKLVFVVALMAALVSCAPKELARKTNLYVSDVSKYEKDGFLISPFDYSGQYYSVAFLEVVILPGQKYVETKNYYNNDINDYKVLLVEPVTYDMLLDTLVNKAKILGADALIGTTFNYDIYGYKASGFAIKRK